MFFGISKRVITFLLFVFCFFQPRVSYASKGDIANRLESLTNEVSLCRPTKEGFTEFFKSHAVNRFKRDLLFYGSIGVVGAAGVASIAGYITYRVVKSKKKKNSPEIKKTFSDGDILEQNNMIKKLYLKEKQKTIGKRILDTAKLAVFGAVILGLKDITIDVLKRVLGPLYNKVFGPSGANVEKLSLLTDVLSSCLERIRKCSLSDIKDKESFLYKYNRAELIDAFNTFSKTLEEFCAGMLWNFKESKANSAIFMDTVKNTNRLFDFVSTVADELEYDINNNDKGFISNETVELVDLLIVEMDTFRNHFYSCISLKERAEDAGDNEN